MLMSPRRRSRIGWRGFQLLSKSAAPSPALWVSPAAPRGPGVGRTAPPGGSRRRRVRGRGARPAPSPPSRLPVDAQGWGEPGCLSHLGGLLLLSPTGALAVNPSRGQDDNPTPRPAVQAEDGLSPKGFQAVSWAWRLGQRSGRPSSESHKVQSRLLCISQLLICDPAVPIFPGKAGAGKDLRDHPGQSSHFTEEEIETWIRSVVVILTHPWPSIPMPSIPVPSIPMCQ
nr:uncharacterized protein LOC105718287 [Aotus nancymaae]